MMLVIKELEKVLIICAILLTQLTSPNTHKTSLFKFNKNTNFSFFSLSFCLLLQDVTVCQWRSNCCGTYLPPPLGQLITELSFPFSMHFPFKRVFQIIH